MKNCGAHYLSAKQELKLQCLRATQPLGWPWLQRWELHNVNGDVSQQEPCCNGIWHNRLEEAVGVFKS